MPEDCPEQFLVLSVKRYILREYQMFSGQCQNASTPMILALFLNLNTMVFLLPIHLSHLVLTGHRLNPVIPKLSYL